MNPSTGRVLSLRKNSLGTFLIAQDKKSDSAQHFKLIKDGRMQSVKYNNTFVTVMSQDGGVQCLGGMGLELLSETSETQEWRNYKYGLVNMACGHSKGKET